MIERPVLFFLSLLLSIGCTLQSQQSQAKTIRVSAANDNLQKVISSAQQGDSVVLSEGTYHGNLIINQSIKLFCEDNVEINGNKWSDTIKVSAENVSIDNCLITDWGNDLTLMNAGIFVEKKASGISINNNRLKGDTFGIWVDAAANATISNNTVEGNTKIRSQDRGNGIHLFNVTGALVKNNEVWHTRDGIYIDTSNQNKLINNELHHLRYGIHYMYSYNNLIKDNYTHHTRTGYALMQSKYLEVINNRSENDTNYAILMNFIVHSTIRGNQLINTRQQQGPGGTQFVKGGEGKALFIYNAPFNKIYQNLITKSEIGIHLTAGSEGNKIYANYFVRNRRQVKYVANRLVEWSFEGKGNFWSDYQGWDRNNDGIGDEPFEPNDNMDNVLWKYPAANLLFNSPAIETLRWVEKAFPVLKSPGIKDSFPLMKNDFSLPELSKVSFVQEDSL